MLSLFIKDYLKIREKRHRGEKAPHRLGVDKRTSWQENQKSSSLWNGHYELWKASQLGHIRKEPVLIRTMVWVELQVGTQWEKKVGQIIDNKHYIVKPFYDWQMSTEHLLSLMCLLQLYCSKNIFFSALRDDLFSTGRKTPHKNSSLVSLVQEWAIISQRSKKSVCVQYWILTLSRVGADGPGPGHRDSIQGKRAVFRLTLLLEEVVSCSLELPILF